MSFGRKLGGGRRNRQRMPMQVAASITAIENYGTAVLVDVSATGAKLSGTDLPRQGQDVWIRVGNVDVLATVMWSRDDQCGVTFDVPLNPNELLHLGGESKKARITSINLAQKLAAEDWESGLAR